MTKVYSLANHILTVALPQALIAQFGADYISIGGEGSYLDSVTVSISNDLFQTVGDYTGSWHHNKNLNAQGTVSVSLNQMSPQVARFKRLCNIFKNGDYDGLTLTLKTLQGTLISTAVDAYITKIPDQAFQTTAQSQTWSFTSGKVTIE